MDIRQITYWFIAHVVNKLWDIFVKFFNYLIIKKIINSKSKSSTFVWKEYLPHLTKVLI